MNPLMFIKPLLGVAKPLLGLAGGLTKNPLSKLVVDKISGGIEHSLEKKKIISSD